MHYIAIKITQITVFYMTIFAPTCFDPLGSSSGSYHTRHEPYKQYRYAATYSTINAFTFINIFYQLITFYHMIL